MAGTLNQPASGYRRIGNYEVEEES
jgi:hypothetical protein